MRGNRPGPAAVVALLLLASALVLSPRAARAQSPIQRWAQLMQRAQFREAEQLARQTVAAERDPERRVRAMTCLALAVTTQDRLDESERILAEARTYCSQTLGDDSHAMADVLKDLGVLRQMRGDYAVATQLLQQSIVLYNRHPLVAGEAIDAVLPLIAIHVEQGELAEAEKLCRQTDATLRRSRFAGNDTKLAANLIYWARLAGDQGRYDLAEPRLRESFNIAYKLYGETPITAETASNLSTALMSQNRYEEARPYLEFAQKITERSQGNASALMAGILVNFGSLHLNTGNPQLALEQFAQSMAIKEALYGPESHHYAKSLISYAELAGELGHLPEVEAGLRRALEIAERVEGPRSANVAYSANVLARLLLRSNQDAEADTFARQAIAIYENSDTTDQACGPYLTRARIAWRAGRKEEGTALLETALGLAEQSRTHAAGAERERASHFDRFGDLFEQMVAWQVDLGQPERALAAIERWRARSFVDELQSANADLLAGRTPQERAQIQARESELRGRITHLERQLDGFVGASSLTPEQQQARDQLLAELAGARNALYEHWRALRASSEVYRRLITTAQHVPTVAELESQLLGPKGMMLAYLFGESSSYVVLLRAGAATARPLSLDEAQAAALGLSPGPLTRAQLARVLADEQGTGVVQQLADPQQAAQATARLAVLWRVLVPQEERAALTQDQVDRLIVLPDGPLSLLPFETLVVEEGANPKYFLDCGPPVLYGPSAAVLANLFAREADTAGAAAAEPVLTMGNPTYADAATNPAGAAGKPPADRGRVGTARMQLSPLPFSGIESQWVAETFGKHGMPALRFAGTKATEAALRAHVAGRRVVHLACHGMSDDAYGNLFGALALAPGKANDPADDGMVRLAEIYDLPLDGCELAILSACVTNYGPQQRGEGVWAISRGFLVAGSKRAVASNWVVDDEAGASLISYFCSLLAKSGEAGGPIDYALALQQAKRWVRAQAKWQSPFYWATFELVGPP